MSAIIERLRNEKELSKSSYRNRGAEAGKAWAEKASYRDLRHVASKASHFEHMYSNYGQIPDDYIFDGSVFECVANEYFEGDPVLCETCEADHMTGNVISIEAAEWIMGWLEAVQKFWNEVESKL